MIDITGLDKAEVLQALYVHSEVTWMKLPMETSDFTIERAKEEIEKAAEHGSLYFDYLEGTLLKIDLSGDQIDEHVYDTELGKGTAQRAINSILKRKQNMQIF